MATKIITPDAFENEYDAFLPPEEKTITKAFLPFFTSTEHHSNFFDQLFESVSVDTKEFPYFIKGDLALAFARKYLSDTQSYLDGLAALEKIPTVDGRSIAHDSDFQKALVECAYDIAVKAGRAFEAIEKYPKQPRMSDGGVILPNDDGGFDDDSLSPEEWQKNARTVMEFNHLSGVGFLPVLARIRQGFSAQSEEYTTSLFVMKDFLNHRRIGFGMQAMGKDIARQKGYVYLTKDDDISWEGFARATRETFRGERKVKYV